MNSGCTVDDVGPRRARMVRFALLLLVAIFLVTGLRAQPRTASLSGEVTDPSGAAVPNATVEVIAASATIAKTTTTRDGMYRIEALPPGKYTVTVSAKGFELYRSQEVQIAAGVVQRVDAALTIEENQQKVEVAGQSPALSINPENNANAIVVSGNDLDALSDDPDQLEADLSAMAGPSIGPDGGQMYVDGFTAGQLPPKSSIKEVRINQNPFAAEYDVPGMNRIDIITKPGAGPYHGQFLVLGNDSAFNTRNPFLGTATLPAYDSTQFTGSFGGPLTKHSSFLITGDDRHISNDQIVDAELEPGIPFTEGVPNPQHRTNISPRVDYQLTPNNMLTLRYQYYRDTQTNDGVGQYALASQGYNTGNTEDTVQLSDSQVFGANVVNEIRFQYLRDRNNQTPLNTTPAVIVPFEFTSGGNNVGSVIDNQDHYEFQENVSVLHGNHLLKFGTKLRDIQETNTSTANFNGTFVFSTLAAYLASAQAAQQGLAPPAGNGPIQFSLTTGMPAARASMFDAGLYIQDDWRWRPNVMISAGLRFETQTGIPDHADWGPRLAVAWGIGHDATKAPKTILRTGGGVFYQRFTSNLILTANRQNGINEQEYIVTNPDFFGTIPPVNTLQSSQMGVPTIYQIAPDLRAPIMIPVTVSIERQVSKSLTLNSAYVHVEAWHQLLTDNVNAPLPGTYIFGEPFSGTRPLGILENVYQYQSAGHLRQDIFAPGFNIHALPRISMFGYYALVSVRADAFGATSSPSNPYNIAADYGRAPNDVRHHVFVGGSITMRHGLRFDPFLLGQSGAPFNVTTGTDVNGDSILNDRPALVSTATCSGLTQMSTNVVCTPLGTFNTLPAAGQKTSPINAYTGPGAFTFNLQVSKTFGFGEAKEVGDTSAAVAAGLIPSSAQGTGSKHRYNLTLAIITRNLFNIVNNGSPAGNLGSMNFDRFNSLATGPFGNVSAVRLIQLQSTLTF